MLSDKKILKNWNRDASKFIENSLNQRNEIHMCYAYRDCNQVGMQTDLADREANGKYTTIVNLMAPLIRTIAGTEAMEDLEIEFVPMVENYNADADIMSDGVRYVQDVSGYHSEKLIAKEDALTCGVGALVTYLDMTQRRAIAGIPRKKRIFPGYVMYDASARGSNINMASRWAGYGDPVEYDSLSDYIIDCVGEEKAREAGASSYLDIFFDVSILRDKVDMLYNYYWWDYEDIYDVENPFQGDDNPIVALVEQDPDIANLVGMTAESLQIDWSESVWSLDPESYRLLQEATEVLFELTGIEAELVYSKRKGKAYFRAEIARGLVLKKSRSFTQTGFPLNFITGYYDEAQGVYYGLSRPMSYIQDMLNLSMSDLMTYVGDLADGGGAYVVGSVDSLEKLAKSKKKKGLTPLPEGTTVTPKANPNSATIHIEFIRLLMDLMPMSVGMSPDYMQRMMSGNMTNDLYSQFRKDSFAVIGNFANNSASFVRREGEINVDLVRLMAKANNGMILPLLSPGKTGEQYKRLWLDNVADEYAIRPVERKRTADEKLDAFNKLSPLVPVAQQFGVNIFPLLAELAPLDQEHKDMLKQLATPQPTPPDPVQQALLQSQVRLTDAQSARLEAQAATDAAKLPYVEEQELSDINQNNAAAMEKALKAMQPTTLPLFPQASIPA